MVCQAGRQQQCLPAHLSGAPCYFNSLLDCALCPCDSQPPSPVSVSSHLAPPWLPAAASGRRCRLVLRRHRALCKPRCTAPDSLHSQTHGSAIPLRRQHMQAPGTMVVATRWPVAATAAAAADWPSLGRAAVPGQNPDPGAAPPRHGSLLAAGWAGVGEGPLLRQRSDPPPSIPLQTHIYSVSSPRSQQCSPPALPCPS